MPQYRKIKAADSGRAVEIASPLTQPEVETSRLMIAAPSDPGKNGKTPILPLALRNNEITESDFEKLVEASQILTEKDQPQLPSPRKIREGKRSKVAH